MANVATRPIVDPHTNIALLFAIKPLPYSLQVAFAHQILLNCMMYAFLHSGLSFYTKCLFVGNTVGRILGRIRDQMLTLKSSSITTCAECFLGCSNRFIIIYVLLHFVNVVMLLYLKLPKNLFFTISSKIHLCSTNEKENGLTRKAKLLLTVSIVMCADRTPWLYRCKVGFFLNTTQHVSNCASTEMAKSTDASTALINTRTTGSSRKIKLREVFMFSEVDLECVITCDYCTTHHHAPLLSISCRTA